MSHFINDVLAVFGNAGPLASAFAGYEPRQGQIEMAVAVAQQIEDGKALMVEAGTGVGKSFAYLVPALLSGEQTIVSTANRVLQDQLVNKDLPVLCKALGVQSSFGALKGKSNYLCQRKLKPLLEQVQGVDMTTGDLDTAPLARRWAAGDDCTGKRCPHRYSNCYYYAAREAAHTYDVLVVNHALLCTHLDHPKAEILPEAHTLIVDEAHQLESYAMGMHKHEVGERHFEGNALDGRERTLARQMIADLSIHAGQEKDVLIPKTLESKSGHELWNTLMDRYGLLSNDPETGDDPEAVRWMRTVENLAKKVQAVAYPTRPPGTVRHAIIDHTGRRALVCEPIHARGLLGQIPDAFAATIYTSATLATSNGFTYAQRALGLEEDAGTLTVASPFDYAAQCCLFEPQDKGMPDPAKQRDLFNKGVAYHMRQLVEVTEGGALLLFTSHWVMQKVGTWLINHCSYPVRIQGDGGRARLIDWLRTTPHAVLCGTASFWEGIDVQGDALRLVVIDKLPVPVPDPVQTARQAEYGSKGFMEVAIPETTLKLKQGFGRLIRSTSDHGIVAILDPRLWTAGWGIKIARALPDATLATTLDEVAEFYEHHFGLREVA